MSRSTNDANVLEYNCNKTNIMSISMHEGRTITSIIRNKNMEEKIAMNNIANTYMEEGKKSTSNVTYITIMEDITTLI